MAKDKSHSNLFIIIFTILILLAGVVLAYQYTGSKVYYQALAAYEDHNWGISNQLFKKYKKLYALVIPSRSTEIDRFLSITASLVEIQQLDEQGNVEQLVSKYQTIAVDYPEIYNNLNFAQKEYDASIQWAYQRYQNSDFEQANRIYSTNLSESENNIGIVPAEVVDDLMPGFYYEWAADLRNKNEFDEANAKYEFLVKTFPDSLFAQKVEEELQNTRMEWAQYLVEEQQFDLAFSHLETILDTWPQTRISDSASDLYIDTGLQYASVLHQNNDFAAEINLLQKIANRMPGAAAIMQVNNQLDLAYESFADQCLENKQYFDAITNYRKVAELTGDESVRSDINAKINTALETILSDSGPDGQQMMQQTAQSICREESQLPEIISKIPENASKIVLCGDNAYGITTSYLASSPAEIKYVVDIQNGIRELERCPYDNYYQLIREQQYVDIIVYNVFTGQHIMNGRIFGTEPEICKEPYQFTAINETVVGAEPEPHQIDTWIAERLRLK